MTSTIGIIPRPCHSVTCEIALFFRDRGLHWCSTEDTKSVVCYWLNPYQGPTKDKGRDLICSVIKGAKPCVKPLQHRISAVMHWSRFCYHVNILQASSPIFEAGEGPYKILEQPKFGNLVRDNKQLNRHTSTSRQCRSVKITNDPFFSSLLTRTFFHMHVPVAWASTYDPDDLSN